MTPVQRAAAAAARAALMVDLLELRLACREPLKILGEMLYLQREHANLLERHKKLTEHLFDSVERIP